MAASQDGYVLLKIPDISLLHIEYYMTVTIQKMGSTIKHLDVL